MPVDISDFDSFKPQQAPTQPQPTKKVDISDFDSFKSPIQPKTEPKGFWNNALQKAEDFGKGLYYGALESAGGIYQKVQNSPVGKVLDPLGNAMWNHGNKELLDQHIKNTANDYQQNVSNWGIPGRVAGNMLGTAPLIPALGGIGQLPAMASSIPGRMALAGAAGVGQGALVGGSSYDQNNPNSQINAQGAMLGGLTGGVLNPVAEALPIIGSKLSKNELAQKAYNNIINSLSSKISDAPDKYTAEKIATKAVQKMAGNIKDNEAQAWTGLMQDLKDKPISDDTLNGLKSAAQGIQEKLGNQVIDQYPSAINKWIDANIIKQPEITFGDLKTLRTQYNDNLRALWKKVQTGDVTADAAKQAGGLYDSITSALRSTADEHGKLDNFITANAFSKEANNFKDITGKKLVDVAVNANTANQFIKKLLPTTSGTGSAQNINLLDQGTANTVRAKALKDALLSSLDPDGGFKIDAFTKAIKTKPQIQGLLEQTPQGKMLNGLMQIIEESQQPATASRAISTFKSLPIVGKVGGGMLDYLTSDGSRSLKSNLINYGLIKNNDGLKEYVGNKITQKLLRAGAGIVNGTLDLQQKQKELNY